MKTFLEKMHHFLFHFIHNEELLIYGIVVSESSYHSIHLSFPRHHTGQGHWLACSSMAAGGHTDADSPVSSRRNQTAGTEHSVQAGSRSHSTATGHRMFQDSPQRCQHPFLC